MRSRGFVVVCLVAFLCLSLLPFVCGLPVDRDVKIASVRHTGASDTPWIINSDNATNTQVSALGMNFISNATAYVSQINLLLKRTTAPAPSGDMYVALYTCAGVIDTNAQPNAQLGISDYWDIMTVMTGAGSYTWYNFTLNTAVQVTKGAQYTVVLGAVCDEDDSLSPNGNYVSWGDADASINSSAAHYHYNAGGWHFMSAEDWSFEVYGDSNYVPAAGGGNIIDLGSWDWAAGIGWVAVLLLMLLPPFVLGVYMRGGKWGFLIGLAIGTGLSYFMFPALVPIWLVILIAMGLGAAFLTSVKEGG